MADSYLELTKNSPKKGQGRQSNGKMSRKKIKKKKILCLKRKVKGAASKSISLSIYKAVHTIDV